jgi:hypothetical protein
MRVDERVLALTWILAWLMRSLFLVWRASTGWRIATLLEWRLWVQPTTRVRVQEMWRHGIDKPRVRSLKVTGALHDVGHREFSSICAMVS